MLTDKQKADGWIEHDGSGRPADYTGGGALLTDGRIIQPPNWAWSPFNGLQVTAYRPEQQGE